jgi:hypothetical protein
MGLGPNGTSLLVKLGRPVGLTFADPFAMMCEQAERQAARRQKAIEHAMKHHKPPKPEAPVEPMPKQSGHPRAWRWIGESIDSKGLVTGVCYQAEQIRKAGYKLPKLEKSCDKLEKKTAKDVS